MIMPRPPRRHVDLEGDLAAQALAGGDSCCCRCFRHLRFPSPPSLRGAKATKQSGLFSIARFLDCFASLAMTIVCDFRVLSRHLVINRIIRIARLLATIEGGAVIGCQRVAVPQP